jgi:hypothetical protein
VQTIPDDLEKHFAFVKFCSMFCYVLLPLWGAPSKSNSFELFL